MKPKPKLPRARVMFATDCANPFAGMRQDKNEFYNRPVLVRPMPSLKSARTRAKWENMSEEEKVERLAKTLCKSRWSSDLQNEYPEDVREFKKNARACLAVMGGRVKPPLG